MNKSQSFCIASRNVQSQRFDEEVVIIDTKSGLYFSLRGSAVDIWSEIEACATQDAILAMLIGRYEGDLEVIRAAVDRCLADLLQGGLIREIPPIGRTAPDAASSGSKQSFVEPLVERFTDMQNLLLLDPIHEVSEEGWPQPAPTKSA